MTGYDLKPLENRLDTLINLFAAQCIGDKNQTEGASFLDKLGVDRKVIAKIYGTTPPAIRSSISQAKRHNDKAHHSKKEIKPF